MTLPLQRKIRNEIFKTYDSAKGSQSGAIRHYLLLTEIWHANSKAPNNFKILTFLLLFFNILLISVSALCICQSYSSKDEANSYMSATIQDCTPLYIHPLRSA